jgi:hypothetical protein
MNTTPNLWTNVSPIPMLLRHKILRRNIILRKTILPEPGTTAQARILDEAGITVETVAATAAVVAVGDAGVDAVAVAAPRVVPADGIFLPRNTRRHKANRVAMTIVLDKSAAMTSSARKARAAQGHPLWSRPKSRSFFPENR